MSHSLSLSRTGKLAEGGGMSARSVVHFKISAEMTRLKKWED